MEKKTAKALIRFALEDFKAGRKDAPTAEATIIGLVAKFNSPVHKRELASYAENEAWSREMLLAKEMVLERAEKGGK